MNNDSSKAQSSKENSPPPTADNDSTENNSSPLQEIPPENCEEEKLPSTEEIDLLSQSLVKYASKHQLSVRNVRSIIKQLLTDERLIIFAQQLAGDLTDTPVRLPEAKSTLTRTKLTRSKRKRNKESLSPHTQQDAATALLNMSFSEEDNSSDEEYNPQLDLGEENEESREPEGLQDDITSPSSLSSLALTPEPAVSDADNFLSLPQTTHTDPTSYLVPAEPSQMESQQQMQSSNSYSTRSRANLKQTTLLELEAGLNAPDVILESPEEISNGGESEAWRNWLASFCLADSPDRSGSDSEDADYNFLQDIDTEIDLNERREEFRYDFQVRVSQREIFELMNSFVEEAGPWGDLPDSNEVIIPEENNNIVQSGRGNNKLTWEVVESGVELTQEQKAEYHQCMNQLQTQLQQHLQMLFQTYVLSLNDPQLETENTCTNQLINDFYSHTNSNQNTIFTFPGLEQAMQLVYSPPDVEWKLKKNKLIPNAAISLMRDYDLFWIFPKLLPHQQLMPLKRTRDDDQKGRKFVLAEDCMLAFGLSVFGLVDGLMKICQYILPTKTPKQIISRIRNLCSSRYETNVVKHWKQTHELRIPWKELEESHPDTLPLWAQQHIEELNKKTEQHKVGIKKIKTKGKVQPIELSPSFVNRMLLECDSIGKNLSQRHRLAIMNIIFDIDKYQNSVQDRNTFYRRLASGLWCFVTTALRCEEATYHQLISTIEHNADGNLHQLVERLSIVLKHHPALLFLFLKFLKTPTQQKEDQRKAFLKAKTFIDRVRDKFKLNPDMAHQVFATINSLSKDTQPNQELEEVIRENLIRFEGSDEIFNQYISEKNEISSVSDDEFEEVYFEEKSSKNTTSDMDFDKYEFEEIYLENPIMADQHTKETVGKKRNTKPGESAKGSNKKAIVAKKGKGEVKSSKRRNNLKTDRNKKQKLNTFDN